MQASGRKTQALAYRINDFCDASGVGRTKVYEEIAAGRLKAVKCGDITLIPAKSGEAWLASLPSKAA